MDFNEAFKLMKSASDALNNLRDALVRAAVLEKKTYKGDAEHTVEITGKGEFRWGEFLKHVAHTAAIGHSFSIVVDPGDKDHEKKFGMDGDGADRILSAKINGKDCLGD